MSKTHRPLFLALFSALSLVAGCASKPALNPSLIRQWNSHLENDFPGKEPGLARYQKDSYELFYLGARHENETDSDTLRLVSQLFEKNKFNVLLIESIPHSSGESPQWFLAEAKKGLKPGFISGGESAWAAILADKNMIPFFAGEPDHQDFYQSLKSLGYTDLDVIGFYVARQTPQWVREREVIKGLIERKAPPFIQYYCKLFAITDCPTLAQVRNWYQEKNGRELNTEITNNDVGPEHNGKLLTQHISSAIGDIRDKFTLNVIQELLTKYKKVAVVYGAGHFITLRKSFDEALGSPTLLRADPKK